MDHLTEWDLIELAAGQLSGQEQLRARNHLASCLACRTRYDQIAQAWEALGQWNVPAGTIDVWASLQGRLPATSPAVQLRSKASAWLWCGRVAAAVLVGVGAGHVLGRWSLPKVPVTVAQVSPVEPAVDEGMVARWLYLTSLDTRTPAGIAEAMLRIPEPLPEEATQ